MRPTTGAFPDESSSTFNLGADISDEKALHEDECHVVKGLAENLKDSYKPLLFPKTPLAGGAYHVLGRDRRFFEAASAL